MENKRVSETHHYHGNFLALLTVLFIGLKLTGHIDWNWALVVLPILIPFIVIFSIVATSLLFSGFVIVCAFVLEKWTERK